MTLLTERYAEQIAGVVSCYDRLVIMGTLPGVCYAEGMAAWLRSHGLRHGAQIIAREGGRRDRALQLVR